MQKREREALREYVDAVCEFSESKANFVRDNEHYGEISVYVSNTGTMSLDEYRGAVSDRLNSADDRLRALGMLP